jgi:hypothetical protein
MCLSETLPANARRPRAHMRAERACPCGFCALTRALLSFVAMKLERDRSERKSLADMAKRFETDDVARVAQVGGRGTVMAATGSSCDLCVATVCQQVEAVCARARG